MVVTLEKKSLKFIKSEKRKEEGLSEDLILAELAKILAKQFVKEREEEKP